ncbi:hypothetical protein [Streptomyces albidus (ex Kaewkla and Franco 2022)]|uniref:hypothetical protein n=1 Tax=Streptomyces albidus (ex Kaewkla and Franco 2022) TaxID=722709 RepID=UPI0028163E15|nr:hypothetical protein [Streptomyces albidus (ex Kaewkla and Franco 2022)]
MQPYEPSRAHHPYVDQRRITGIPGMRLSHDNPSGGSSATPIYDSLYAEYSRLFRTLPGDRTGEEELRFEGFGTVHGTGTGQWGNGSWRGEEWPHEVLPARSKHTPPALPPGRHDGQPYGH